MKMFSFGTNKTLISYETKINQIQNVRMQNSILDIILRKYEDKWFFIPIKPFTSIKELPIQLEIKSGIYQIKTNTPIDILSKYGKKRKDNAHYNFQKKIKESLQLQSLIVPEDLDNGYVVYTGHKHISDNAAKNIS